MTPVPAALASVAFAVLVAVAGYVTTTPLALAAAVGLVVLVLAIGWGRLLELPAPWGTGVVVAAVGAAAVALGQRVADVVRPLAPFTALLAAGVLLAFVHELLRRRGRDRLVESVTGTVSGLTVALLGGGWLLLPRTVPASAAVLTAAVAVAAARLAVMAPVDDALVGWVALAAGSVAGGSAAAIADLGHLVPLLAVAVVCAAVTAGLSRLLDRTAPGLGVAAGLAAAAAPVLASGTVAFAVVRFFS